MVGWKKSLNQPAKLAVRVLAPGDGEAEPGETNQHTFQPTKWVTDETWKTDWTTSATICRRLRRLSKIAGCYPRLGFAIAWG